MYDVLHKDKPKNIITYNYTNFMCFVMSNTDRNSRLMAEFIVASKQG